jgi:hypothetical protein
MEKSAITPTRGGTTRRRGWATLGGILAVAGIVAVTAAAVVILIPRFTAALAVPSGTDAVATEIAPSPGDSPTPFVGVQGDVPSVETINGDPDLRNDVVMAACAVASGGWQASGTANNPSSSARTLAIVVTFTDAQARAITSAKTSVTVAPGATESWSASAEFTAPAGTACVLSGVDEG